MDLVISGRDWRLLKYHPRNPAFDADDENEREGDKVLGPLVFFIR